MKVSTDTYIRKTHLANAPTNNEKVLRRQKRPMQDKFANSSFPRNYQNSDEEADPSLSYSPEISPTDTLEFPRQLAVAKPVVNIDEMPSRVASAQKMKHFRQLAFSAALGDDVNQFSADANIAKKNRFSYTTGSLVALVMLLSGVLCAIFVHTWWQNAYWQNTAQIPTTAQAVKSTKSATDKPSVESTNELNSLNAKRTNNKSKAETVQFAIYITGAVKQPGVVYLPEDSRIVSAIEAAGGFSEQADQRFINLARPVVDGQQIYVPAIGEDLYQLQEHLLPTGLLSTGSAGGESETGNALGLNGKEVGGKINLNNASVQDLQSIPGIGPVTAELIVRYRNEHGNFAHVEDLMQISGIGSATLSKIKPYVTL